MCRHRAWDLFEHLVDGLPSGSRFTAQQLASLLLDRSTPRPASLRAAGPWWDETVADLAAGRVIPEAVWCSEDEVPACVDDREGRRLYGEALAAALVDRNPTWPADEARPEHTLMGAVMPRLRGRVPGRLVRQWVGQTLKEARS